MKRQSAPFTAEKLSELAKEILPVELVEMWQEYIQMRNRLAKTRIETDRSQERIFRQLLNFSADNDKRRFSLEQSTDFKYRGFFEPKHDYLRQFQKAKHKREDVLQSNTTDKPVLKTEKTEHKKKYSIRDKVRDRAKNGCTASISMVRKWDNPTMVEALKKHKEEQRKIELNKLVLEDERKGIKASF